jgi:hypothetical protein
MRGVLGARLATLGLVASMTVAIGRYIDQLWLQMILLTLIWFYGVFAMTLWNVIERTTDEG